MKTVYGILAVAFGLAAIYLMASDELKITVSQQELIAVYGSLIFAGLMSIRAKMEDK